MVLDTSRNFHHYRTLLSANNVSAPMLPYLPLVLKDLTFIHLGNPSCTPDGLINFVKLRMLAKEKVVDYSLLLLPASYHCIPVSLPSLYHKTLTYNLLSDPFNRIKSRD
ncbi:unnamed protein product [Schistosoma curassoni]|uniref:Ras-GEF domain-containing protein n=1 Tax=Schistosoma curassoni TaxID=6186 RepID=A0A183KMA9_9TREM|nr:unnamed protein product [Schistosoma curassoni]